MELSLLSYNIHKGVGWRSRASTIDKICEQLTAKSYDLVFFQEMIESQFSTFAEKAWPYCIFAKNHVHRDSHQGNAIISKTPVQFINNLEVSINRYEHRGVLHVVGQLNGKVLHLICLHLGLFPQDRRKQLSMIIDYVNANIPPQEMLIMSGDFNDWAIYASTPLKNHLNLEEAFLTEHKHHAKTYPAWAPIFKLDRIYYRGIKLKGANRLVKHPWNLLSDHLAIEAIFEY